MYHIMQQLKIFPIFFAFFESALQFCKKKLKTIGYVNFDSFQFQIENLLSLFLILKIKVMKFKIKSADLY